MRKLFVFISVMQASLWGQAVSPTINPTPTRQFGHPSLAVPLTQASPNLVEGRELFAPGQIALDTSVNPPILYIADSGNNRVMAYKTSSVTTPGKFADLVIGQADFVSALAQGGANSALTTGFNTPIGVAVDSKGNLYVADAGNNRILRFPTPFNNPGGSVPVPDIVIGQKGFSTGNSPNEGGGSRCTAKSLWFSNGGSAYPAALAIDGNGNLWSTDTLNNRVLMYPAASLTSGAAEVPATVVLGQNDFTTNSQANGFTQLTKTGLYQPVALAFDSSGNLYVADAYSRVLYYTGPSINLGQSAARVLGIPPPPQQGQPAVVYPNQYTLGSGSLNSGPYGLFTSGNNLFVADTVQSRIVEYDIPANWTAESTTTPSPQILNVYGQIVSNVGKPNQGQPQPAASTLAVPYSGAFDKNNTMWVADTGNNRVLAFPVGSAGSYNSASMVVGQLDFFYNAPNLIEGREVFLSGAGGSAAGMVVDKNSNPPHLYIADPGNNRILCFNDARKVGQTTPPAAADLVIGQPDFRTSQVNYPNGLALSPSATGLYSPIGVAVDNKGNLYVADAGNGRVVRFPAPFAQPLGQQATANLVLGQPNFTTVIQNASANSMHTPWGIALFAGSDANATPLAGGIAVSDPAYNRVLIFSKGAGGDFTNGQNAYLVIGQSSFSTISAGSGLASFSSPRGIASDTSDRLYVADAANGRVLAFGQAPEQISNGPTAAQQYTGLSQPYGVAVSSITTELWVANSGSNQIWRYPEYNRCALISCAVTSVLYANAAPLGIALDATDNVIVGDVANRITLYYAQAFFRNAANFNTQGLAPGELAVLGRLGLPMSVQTAQASAYPWPMTLADLNVTVNGTPAPVFATNAGYGAVYLQVPYEAPTSGTANFIITQASTGAILGVGTFQMAKSNPGFFTANQQGTGQVIALNLDGSNTLNGSSNPIARGANIEFCLTGLGAVSGAPADGYPPTSAVSAPIQPVIAIGGVQLTSAQILYSGLGCGFPGGWQINATVPQAVAPGTASVALLYNNIASNIGGTTSSDGITPGPDQKLTGALATTITVK
ncbi:MAG TPA: hypothetical protein VMT15_00545 [Bryobacteraceae bacterium]|nr:hypothetical protein [Bryobacteraceae bacterium]